MKYLLIRHARTDANRLTRAAFGKSGASINDEGQRQAKSLRAKLQALDIDLDNESVAVSELLRTQQTAKCAGFKNLVVNKSLNEVNTSNPKKTLELIEHNLLPDEAIDAAHEILKNPPKEKIWITHGLVITAVLVALGLLDDTKFIPSYCEITEIEF